jgi:hypothetical protein
MASRQMELTSNSDPSVSPGPRALQGAQIADILRRNGWFSGGAARQGELALWLDRAAMLLSTQAEGEGLEDLLRLIFQYDAASVLSAGENQDVLMREGARRVIRELANQVLGGGDIESDRFKEIVEALKLATPYRSRDLFQPIRVALAGRAGEGGLDRVILLLDAAAKLEFESPVKSTRQRIIEFCAALD